MESYQEHNIYLYSLRILLPASLILALFGFRDLGLILYGVCFGISVAMTKLKRDNKT